MRSWNCIRDLSARLGLQSAPEFVVDTRTWEDVYYGQSAEAVARIDGLARCTLVMRWQIHSCRRLLQFGPDPWRIDLVDTLEPQMIAHLLILAVTWCLADELGKTLLLQFGCQKMTSE